MIRFAANLDMLFSQVPQLDRFQLAADAGFRVVEIWTPYTDELSALIRAKESAGVDLLQFNLDRVDFFGGERGYLPHPDQRARFCSDVEKAVECALELGVCQLNCLCGSLLPDYSLDEQLACIRQNLEWLSPLVEAADLYLNIEPMNSFNVPDYFFVRPRDLFTFLSELGLPRIGVQYDVYHAQMMEGNLVSTMKEFLHLIGHVQIADVPGRNQPGTGEINYGYLLTELETMGFARYVSLEYVPLGLIEEALAWLPKQCREQAASGDLQFWNERVT